MLDARILHFGNDNLFGTFARRGQPGENDDALEPDELVDITLNALAKEQFMISTHDLVTQLFRLKASDFEKYLDTMKQQRKEEALLDQQ